MLVGAHDEIRCQVGARGICQFLFWLFYEILLRVPSSIGEPIHMPDCSYACFSVGIMEVRNKHKRINHRTSLFVLAIPWITGMAWLVDVQLMPD